MPSILGNNMIVLDAGKCLGDSQYGLGDGTGKQSWPSHVECHFPILPVRNKYNMNRNSKNNFDLRSFFSQLCFPI